MRNVIRALCEMTQTFLGIILPPQPWKVCSVSNSLILTANTLPFDVGPNTLHSDSASPCPEARYLELRPS